MADQDFKKFYESVNAELLGIKDRVRDIIGNANWGSDGAYKEAILKNVIAKFLPKNYSIASGFVINPAREITRQIDIIIYDDSSPVLFREGDFAIVLSHTVRGIIEVKTRIDTWQDLNRIIETANENGKIIKTVTTQSRPMFNGVFAYETNLTVDEESKTNLATYFMPPLDFFRIVNNIALGNNYFFHVDRGMKENMCAYKLTNLSFSYFISNLLVVIDTNPVEHENQLLYFPLETKGNHEIFCVE